LNLKIKSCYRLRMPVQTQIKTLLDASMALLNVRENKVPIHTHYLTDDVETLIMKFDAEINEPNGYAIRMGFNDVTHETFISLDFDCCKKDEKTGSYIDCKNTQRLLQEYQEQINSTDGMFKSSTEGNYNVIVNITNSEILKELLEYKPAVWSAMDYGLEVLQHKIQVVPPTATKCKKNSIINGKNPRRWLSDKLIYAVEDDCDPIVKYIENYFQLPSGKAKKKQYETKKTKQCQYKFEEAETEVSYDTDYILCKDNLKLTEKILMRTILKKQANEYDSWWKMGYALFNTHGEQAKELFIKFSTCDKYRDTGVMSAYWKNNICGFKKVTTSYKTYNSWYIVKLLKCLDNENFTKYIEEIYDDLRKFKLLEQTKTIEDPDGQFRLAKIVYGGNNFLIYNRPEDKVDIVDWSTINHILSDQVNEGFLDDWLKNKNKKSYDKVDFKPYGKVKPNIYNLFKGFKYHPKILDDTFIPNWEHIKHFKEYTKRICSNDEKASSFLEQNLAWICFKGRPCQCIILYGRQGTGKSTLTLLIKELVGKEYCKDDYDTKNGLFKNFNSAFEGKIMVFINEPDWNSFSSNIGIFKHTITDDTLRIEKKGVDSYDVTNEATYWISTNNKNLFNQEKDDRRFFFLMCQFLGYTPEEKKEYFDDFYNNKLKNEEYLCSVLWYLYNEVLKDNYNFEYMRTQCLTEYHKIIADTYKDTDIDDWLVHYLTNQQAGFRLDKEAVCEIDGWINPLDTDYWVTEYELYDKYKIDNDGSKITSKDIFIQQIKIVSQCNDITSRRNNKSGTRTKYIKIMGSKIKDYLVSSNVWK